MSDSAGRKSDPLAKLRHDLRTPINQILGYSELLQEEAEEKGETARPSCWPTSRFKARHLHNGRKPRRAPITIITPI